MVPKVEPLREYESRGLRFGSFYSPEDSNALARVARRVARGLPQGIILDLGCGTAMPTLHACGGRHAGIGLDLDADALAGASLNAKLLSRRNVAFVRADFLSATGRFAMVMSNPPYIPTDRRTLAPALEVQGDGTGAIEAIFNTYGNTTRDFVLHFASISNPPRICQLANRAGFGLVHLQLTLVPFGTYTSVPRRLRHLLECRRQHTAFFHGSDSARGAKQFTQLLMTAHFSVMRRRNHPRANGAVLKMLEAFQAEGVQGFRGIRALARGFSLEIVVPSGAVGTG